MTLAECPESRENITDIVVLDNELLTYKARGVLLHLSSTYMPGTQISAHRLMSGKGGEGRESIRAILAELAEHGYLSRGRGTAWVFRGDPTRWTV